MASTVCVCLVCYVHKGEFHWYFLYSLHMLGVLCIHNYICGGCGCVGGWVGGPGGGGGGGTMGWRV